MGEIPRFRGVKLGICLFLEKRSHYYGLKFSHFTIITYEYRGFSATSSYRPKRRSDTIILKANSYFLLRNRCLLFQFIVFMIKMGRSLFLIMFLIFLGGNKVGKLAKMFKLFSQARLSALPTSCLSLFVW